jgi:hypothetical protein
MQNNPYPSSSASLFASHARSSDRPQNAMRLYRVWRPGDAEKVSHYLTPAQAEQFRRDGYRVEEE